MSDVRLQLRARALERVGDLLDGVPTRHTAAVMEYVVSAFADLSPKMSDRDLLGAFDAALPRLTMVTVLFLESVRDTVSEFWLSEGGASEPTEH